MDASSSKSFTGSITGYAWDFGDGSQGQGAKTSHTYEAPSVDAGEAQTVVLGSAAHLSALIEDDGLSGNATQVSWSLDSETDVAQILDETAESTSVQFSQVGQYLLRVKVSDGELEAEDTVLITVIETPEQAIDLLSPVGGEVLGAGSTHAIRWTTQDIADVGLDYSCDDGETWERIGFVDDSLDTWGHYPWQVPNWPSASCLVRIMGYSGEAPTQSDDVFRIVSEGALSLADGLGYTAIGGCNVPPAQISAWALLLVVSFLLHLRLRLRRDRRHIARTQVLQPTRSFQLVRSGRLRADAK